VVLSQSELLDVNDVPLNIRESVQHMKNHVTESVLVDGSLADTENRRFWRSSKRTMRTGHAPQRNWASVAEHSIGS
jgi:hypothetical protein